ncbi:MAG: hypothetical protein Cpurp_10140 [Chlorogloea purpurea SAG 13.99]|nr:hypothetical protein [Chlorogloea purpurea SAG 13.99]
MNNQFSRLYTSNDSGIGCLLTLVLGGLLLGSVGWGWVVNGFFILGAIILLLPLVAWLGLRWWLSRNLVQSLCPVCSYEFTGFNRTECQCPNCGESLKVEGGTFQTLTPPGTIDVEAVEIPYQGLED